jgi:molybdenum cofactor cytidylyltransferase
MSRVRIGGLIISAGLSSRMGNFKPLMEFNGETFIEGITKKLAQVCDKVVIVTGYQKEKIESVLSSQFSIHQLSDNSKLLSCVFNPFYESGMFTSLQTGINNLNGCDWVLYHFVDQPFHKIEFYESLKAQIDDNYDWIQPVHDGKYGHPVLFNKRVLGMIKVSSPESNLKIVSDSASIKKKYWNCNHPEVLIDFDTEDDIKNFQVS